MDIRLLKARLAAGFMLGALPVLSWLGHAQEPSPGLKQAESDYRAGVAALSRHDLNAALADFEKVVHLAPAAEQGHSALGAILLRLGRTSEAIRELEKALAITPSDRSAQLNLAFAYEQSGEARKALPWFAKLEAASRLEKSALPPYIFASYSRALAATQQFPAAISNMKLAVAGDPQNAEWQDELGSLYAQRQDWADATKAFTAALQLSPDSAMVHLHLGITLQAGQQPGALDELKKASQLAPQNAAIALQLGQALANAGQDAQAIPVLRHALELDPALAAAAYQLGLALQRSNQLPEAVPLLQKALAADPDNGQVLTNLGMALCQAQQAKDAVPILQRAVARMPDDATAHQNLAAAYIQLSQFDDAVAQLRTAVEISPNAAQLHYNLGLAFKMQDDAANAIPELERAEKLDASASEPPYALGVLYLQAGRYADAERELNLSLKLRPENGEGWAMLGSVDNNLNKLPEAAAALKEAIRQLPQQADPHLTLASVLVKQNDPAGAAAERKKGAALMHTNMNRQQAEVACNSGNSLLKSGKVEDAIVDFRSALSYDPDYAEAHRGLSKGLEQQGKLAESTVERQKAEALEKVRQ
ncbi:tetratricopeptide (TPR) repeat protein [Silvibacterium bohemicum]|uniref:Tetratricopeptide (TPR) repeat protein n=1 Tax=Silvibacterium bohemicum TaxID=1577686 RepID=A0A841JT26_9BACT|nr:tetratricopeptide repeat protein [Silvibacterium bohemicum]MBB6142909.1 tetratricopeptide (TPR) repeat protein [Silvibacterium bohemicum]